MSDYTWSDFQRQENGDPPETPSYTADEVAEYRHDNPDDPGCEVLQHVMARAMHDRERYYERRYHDLLSSLDTPDREDDR